MSREEGVRSKQSAVQPPSRSLLRASRSACHHREQSGLATLSTHCALDALATLISLRTPVRPVLKLHLFAPSSNHPATSEYAEHSPRCQRSSAHASHTSLESRVGEDLPVCLIYLTLTASRMPAVYGVRKRVRTMSACSVRGCRAGRYCPLIAPLLNTAPSADRSGSRQPAVDRTWAVAASKRPTIAHERIQKGAGWSWPAQTAVTS